MSTMMESLEVSRPVKSDLVTCFRILKGLANITVTELFFTLSDA